MSRVFRQKFEAVARLDNDHDLVLRWGPDAYALARRLYLGRLLVGDIVASGAAPRPWCARVFTGESGASSHLFCSSLSEARDALVTAVVKAVTGDPRL